MPASIQVGVEATGFEASLLKQGQSAFSKLGGIFGKSLDAAGFNNAFGSMNTNVRTFEKSLDFANRRVVAFGTSATLVYGTVRAFRELLTATIDVEKSLTSINSIFGLSQRQLDSFGKTLFNVARETGQSFQEAAKAAEEFSRQGLSVSETAKRTRDALILVRLTGLDASSAVETLTASINTFGKAGLDTTAILNKMVAVDQSFAVSTRDISEAIARAGSTINDSGASLDKFIGLVTAAKQITSRDGSVIGNSLKTIFTRLERETTLEKLEAMGIAVRKLNGEMLPAAEILDRVAVSYKGLSREQQNQVSELGSGIFQINQFKALMLDLGKANGIAAQATKTSTDAVNEAIVRNSVLNQTLATQLENLKTNATQAASTVGDLALKPALGRVLDTGNFLTEWAQRLKSTGDTKASEDLGAYIGESILKGIGNVITGPGLAILTRLLAGAILRTFPEIVNDLQTTIGFTQVVKTPNVVPLGPIPSGNIGAPARGLRRAAEGYLPAMSAERSAISMGVGGAPQTARPVVLPRFNFGGGQVGPLVANSSEYIAHMAGGGMGVFNQDMIRRGGLPRGATPVAAGGYVPNAADGGPLRSAVEIATGTGLPRSGSPVTSYDAALSRVSPGLAALDAEERAWETALNDFQKNIQSRLAQRSSQMAVRVRDFGKAEAEILQQAPSVSSSARAFNQSRTDLETKKQREMEEGFRLMEKENEQTKTKTGLTQQEIRLANEGLTERRETIAAARQVRAFATLPIRNYSQTPTNTAGFDARMAAYSAAQGPYTAGGGTGSPILGSPLGQNVQTMSMAAELAAADRAKTVREAAALRNAQISARIQNLAMVAAFGSAFLPEGEPGTNSGMLLGGIRGAAQYGSLGASLGGVLGLPGAIVGGGLGVIGGGIAGASPASTDRFKPYQDAALKRHQQMDRANEAFSLQDQIAEARNNGAPGDAIVGLTRQFNSALSDVEDPTIKDLILGSDVNPDNRAEAARLMSETNQTATNKDGPMIAFSKAMSGNIPSNNPFAGPRHTSKMMNEAVESLRGSFSNFDNKQLANILGGIQDPETMTKIVSDLGGAYPDQDTPDTEFAQEAIQRAVHNAADNRRFVGAANAKREAFGPVPQSERLRQISEYEKFGQSTALSGAGDLQTAETRQRLRLARPLDDPDRLVLERSFAKENLQAATRTSLESTALSGRAGLIQSLGNSGGKQLFDEIGKANDLTGLQALQSKLNTPGPGGALGLGATPQFKTELSKLIEKLSAMQEATEVNTRTLDDDTKAQLEYLNFARSPQGVKTLFTAAAEIDTQNRNRSNRGIISLGQEGNRFVSGSQIESAALDESQRLGREGDYVGSFEGGFGSRFAGLKRDIKQFADVGQEVGRSLETNLGNAFGDFVTGAKKGKDAFRDFVSSLANDAARAFGTKAVQSLLGLTLGNLLPGFNLGDIFMGTPVPVGATGGALVPSMLMGGEYVFNPQQAAAIGPRNLAAVNAGSAPRFAFGGMVRGGSGVTDDRPMGLAAGSFVVKRSSVSQYGEGYLSSLAARAGGGGASLSIGSYEGGGSVSSPVPFAMGGAVSAGGAASVNIGVTINDHRTTTKTETQGGGMDRSFAEGVGKQIRQVVIAEIANQTRTGGMLRRQSLANT